MQIMMRMKHKWQIWIEDGTTHRYPIDIVDITGVGDILSPPPHCSLRISQQAVVGLSRIIVLLQTYTTE